MTQLHTPNSLSSHQLLHQSRKQTESPRNSQSLHALLPACCYLLVAMPMSVPRDTAVLLLLLLLCLSLQLCE